MEPTPAADSASPTRRTGGRKPGPVAAKQRHVVSVRLTDAEHERLSREAERHRLSQAEVLRSVWLKQDTAAKLPTPRTPEQARELAQLAGMATNLNQLTKQGHLGQPVGQGVLVVLRQMHALLKQLNPPAA